MVLDEMIFVVDTQYHDDGTALIAGGAFKHWTDDKFLFTADLKLSGIGVYEPGNFYQRELPGIIALLNQSSVNPNIIVIDGYVWLNAEGRAGLGAHLYEALKQKVVVIGVAKSSFVGSPHAEKVLRGQSKRPLYVTAAGIDATKAAKHIESMHGEYRFPTLLKEVDRLCRNKVN